MRRNCLSNAITSSDTPSTPSLCHTWNDSFSEEMDKNRVGEEQEKKARSYLMGWSETSGTAATYTRRHIRKRAQAASLQLQKNVIERSDDE